MNNIHLRFAIVLLTEKGSRPEPPPQRASTIYAAQKSPATLEGPRGARSPTHHAGQLGQGIKVLRTQVVA